MKKQILLSLFLLVAYSGFTQTAKVSGKITDSKGQPLEYATIMLLRASDSSLVKGAISDSTGSYHFEKLEWGSYQISAGMVGYEKKASEIFSLTKDTPSRQLQPLPLAEETRRLDEVVVEAQRPLLEQQADRLVINVEGSILAGGGTAMEILEKSPGITVDRDGNISLKGKQGVIIMMDGKQTYLSAQEVSNMLSSMSADAIEKIELITNPSAKYDAAGNSGIINIRTRKNKNMGMNGSLTAGTGYGRYEKANTGINLNYRKSDINLFGSYDYRYNHGYSNTFVIDRYSITPTDTTIFNQRNFRPFWTSNHQFKGGLDWFLNEKNTLGILVRGYSNVLELDITGDATATNPDNEKLLWLDSHNDAYHGYDNMSYNLNYRRTFEQEGRELTADLDYSRFIGTTFNGIDNYFYYGRLSATPDSSQHLRSDIPSVIDIKVAKIDYIHPLREKGGRLEIGAKSSMVTTDNDVHFDEKQGEQWVVDEGKTNHFVYQENIHAAYLNWSGKIGNYDLQAGLRGEQTSYEGESITMDSLVNDSYLKLFPSLFVSRKFNEAHQLNFSYSRRIDRPSYQSLNPFIYYLDPYQYYQGNPLLQPQFTHNIELSHTLKGTYITSLGYSHTSDVLTQVTEQDDVRKVTKATTRNLQTLSSYNLTMSAPVTVAKWWNMSNNFNAFYNQYEGLYLGEQLTSEQFSFNLNINNRFTLPAGFSAELSGVYHSPGTFGLARYLSRYAVNAGLQKTFWDKKANLKLNVSDLFNTLRFDDVVDFANMDYKTERRWESRVARLTFTYNFGNKDVKPQRRRQTGSEEEQQRIGG
ncbi:outer membrane beta-barrel family protein [Nafulsella turpanensis]|uniref:outer membrane beta-barrel family protein n=1 Tax=Nafulsella turpanensis TaxID=1265690 RepID=UPI0003648FEC|nr:outer membrane beta-barrel family protein [Nafulsella turpanensis]